MRMTLLALLLSTGAAALADSSLPGKKKDWPTNESCGAKAAPSRCDKVRAQGRADLEKAYALRRGSVVPAGNGDGRLELALPNPAAAPHLTSLLVFVDGVPVLDLCDDPRTGEDKNIDIYAARLPSGRHVVGVRADYDDRPHGYDGTINVAAGTVSNLVLRLGAARIDLAPR